MARRQRQDNGQWTWSWPCRDADLDATANVHQDISGNIMEVFFYEWKEEDRNCKFPRFHLGGNDGEKETPSCQ